MAASILIVYATRYGSTREVADAVGARLRERGFTAEVRPAREVGSLDGVSAVVLGSPLYIGSLLREARKFLERHRAALSQMPVAIFALGPISGGKKLEGSRTQLAAALAKLPWLQPAAGTGPPSAPGPTPSPPPSTSNRLSPRPRDFALASEGCRISAHALDRPNWPCYGCSRD